MSEALKLGASVEISGVLLSNKIAADEMGQFKSDPKAYAFQKADIDLGDRNLSVVENSSDTVHLALPFYSALDNNGGTALDDDELGNVAGGEFWIIAIIGSIIGIGIAGTAIAGTTTALVATERAGYNENLDGSSK